MWHSETQDPEQKSLGNADPYIMDTDPFIGTFTSVFKDNKSLRSHITV
jgi:hypothetical protein